MRFIVEHPIIAYLCGSALFATYLLFRFSPEQIRTRSENLKKVADGMQKLRDELPFPEIWPVSMALVSLLWIFLVPLAAFRMLYRIVWGVEKLEDV